jgi:hypothetical protein
MPAHVTRQRSSRWVPAVRTMYEPVGSGRKSAGVFDPGGKGISAAEMVHPGGARPIAVHGDDWSHASEPGKPPD